MKYFFLALFAVIFVSEVYFFEVLAVMAFVMATVLTFVIAVTIFVSNPNAFVKEFGRHDPVAKKEPLHQEGISLPDGERQD